MEKEEEVEGEEVYKKKEERKIGREEDGRKYQVPNIRWVFALELNSGLNS